MLSQQERRSPAPLMGVALNRIEVIVSTSNDATRKGRARVPSKGCLIERIRSGGKAKDRSRPSARTLTFTDARVGVYGDREKQRVDQVRLTPRVP